MQTHQSGSSPRPDRVLSCHSTHGSGPPKCDACARGHPGSARLRSPCGWAMALLIGGGLLLGCLKRWLFGWLGGGLEG